MGVSKGRAEQRRPRRSYPLPQKEVRLLEVFLDDVPENSARVHAATDRDRRAARRARRTARGHGALTPRSPPHQPVSGRHRHLSPASAPLQPAIGPGRRHRQLRRRPLYLREPYRRIRRHHILGPISGKRTGRRVAAARLSGRSRGPSNWVRHRRPFYFELVSIG